MTTTNNDTLTARLLIDAGIPAHNLPDTEATAILNSLGIEISPWLTEQGVPLCVNNNSGDLEPTFRLTNVPEGRNGGLPIHWAKAVRATRDVLCHALGVPSTKVKASNAAVRKAAANPAPVNPTAAPVSRNKNGVITTHKGDDVAVTPRTEIARMEQCVKRSEAMVQELTGVLLTLADSNAKLAQSQAKLNDVLADSMAMFFVAQTRHTAAVQASPVATRLVERLEDSSTVDAEMAELERLTAPNNA